MYIQIIYKVDLPWYWKTTFQIVNSFINAELMFSLAQVLFLKALFI